MAEIYFVWLGSGRAKRRRVGPEGQLLDQAAKAGLPVAPGAILLDEFYRVCLEKGLAEMLGGRLIIPDPELLHATLFYSARLPRFERPVAANLIVPADIDEDALPTESFQSLIIDAGRPDELARALAVAWKAADHNDARRDVLLIEEIAAEHSGRACMGVDQREHQIERDGRDDSEQASFSLPVLTGWQKPDEELPPYARRLQMLLRGVRRTFGRGEWVVEWADDGDICRLRRITAPRPLS